MLSANYGERKRTMVCTFCKLAKQYVMEMVTKGPLNDNKEGSIIKQLETKKIG